MVCNSFHGRCHSQRRDLSFWHRASKSPSKCVEFVNTATKSCSSVTAAILEIFLFVFSITGWDCCSNSAVQIRRHQWGPESKRKIILSLENPREKTRLRTCQLCVEEGQYGTNDLEQDHSTLDIQTVPAEEVQKQRAH